MNQVGDEVEAPGPGLDSDPPGALFLAGNLDSGSPGEAVSHLGPFLPGQLPVVRSEAHLGMEERPPVGRCRRERVVQTGINQVLGPLDGCPGPVHIVPGE